MLDSPCCGMNMLAILGAGIPSRWPLWVRLPLFGASTGRRSAFEHIVFLNNIKAEISIHNLYGVYISNSAITEMCLQGSVASIKAIFAGQNPTTKKMCR